MSIHVMKMQERHMKKGEGLIVRPLPRDVCGTAAKLEQKLPEDLEDRKHVIHALLSCAALVSAEDKWHIFILFDGPDQRRFKNAYWISSSRKAGASGLASKFKKEQRQAQASQFVIAKVWKSITGGWQFKGPTRFQQFRLSHKHAIKSSINAGGSSHDAIRFRAEAQAETTRMMMDETA